MALPVTFHFNCPVKTQHSTNTMCYSHLAKFEAKFDANLLLLYISHFSRAVQLQNSKTLCYKNTHKKHKSTQHNATWQTGSQKITAANT
jgi:hypothetical protein